MKTLLRNQRVRRLPAVIALCASLALPLPALAWDGFDADSADLADAAVHFGLLSYAAGLVSRQYVAQLRAQAEPEPDRAEGKKAAKARKEHKA